MSNLFATLEREAFRNGITPRSKQSRAWFQKKAKELTTVNRRELMRAEELDLSDNFVIGNLYMFFYDPKTKDTLPYYDKFPLAIIVDFAPDGFYGINLHYLPLPLRAKLLDALLDNTTNKRYDKTTRFRINYRMLKAASKTRYFKPCFKHYLADHVQGNFAKVAAPEWEIATFLPTAIWKKGSQSEVYRDSRNML
jgi:hypothetical protein